MKNRYLWCVTLLCVGGCLTLGCKLFGDPGGQAKEVLLQKHDLTYGIKPDGSGEFKSEAIGTQEARVMVIEAQGDLVLTPDGDIDVERSTLTSYTYISADPSASRVTENVGLGAFAASNAQYQMLNEAVMNTINMIPQIMGAYANVRPPPPPAASPEDPPPWMTDLIERIEALEDPDPG